MSGVPLSFKKKAQSSPAGSPRPPPRERPTPSSAASTAARFFSNRRRHTRYWRDWSSDVCSSDLWGRWMVPFGHASLDVRAAQYPGCAHAGLRRRQLFQPNPPRNSGRCDAECGGAFTDGHLAAGLPLSLTVDRNRMVVAQRADTLRSPDLSVCRAALIPIQDRGDPRVWFDPRQHANDLHEIIVGDIPMPATANLLKLYLRMIPALPMQYEAYCLAFTRGDDLFQSDTKEAFLVLWQTVRIVPEYGEIPREGQQFPFLRVGEWVLATLLQRHELGFKLRLRGQRLVPAAF